MKLPAFSLILSTAISCSVLAQSDPDSLKTYNLEEVVVTGQFEPQSVEKSVFKIRTIPMERILARGAVRLEDVLKTELNIRFDQDLATGTSKISMQGLEGQNVKLLIDGIPQVGRQSTDNSFNINQVNVNSIERIEIIEGPMSVIYGADALAGVINIITRKNPDGKLDLTARVHEESVGKEYGLDRGIHNESAGVAYSKDKFNTRVDFSRNFFGGFRNDTIAREEQWHPKSQWLGNALLGFNGERSRVYYRADYMYEDIYNPGAFASGTAFDQNYISTRLMHQLQGAHTFNTRFSFNGAFSYTNYSRKTRSTNVTESTGDVRLALGEGLQDRTTFNGATFRGTFQYRINNTLTIQPGFDLNHETGEGGRIKPGQHPIGDYAVFLSAEWNVTSRVQLRPGLRTTYNTQYDAPPVMPSINTKVNLTERTDLKLSYGRGFRAPSLRELYFNFIDASHNIIGNPDLKPETSNSFNASWNWRVIEQDGTGKLTTAIGGFYNDVNDRIDYGLNGGTTTTLINISRYKTKGLTWNNTWRNRRWNINAGASYTGKYPEIRGDELPEFIYTPEITATGTYRTLKGGWNFSVYYKYTGKTPFSAIAKNGDLYIAKADAYHWADASIQKQFFKNFTATAGIRNLFNVVRINSTGQAAGGTHSAGAIRPIGSGRAYYLSLTYMFNQ